LAIWSKNVLLIAAVIVAFPTMMWANNRIWARVRESGHRYWLFNPLALLAGLRGFEVVILAVAAWVGAYAARELFEIYVPHIGSR